MAWVLKALMGTGIVASVATVAVVSTPSLREKFSLSKLTETVRGALSPSNSGTDSGTARQSSAERIEPLKSSEEAQRVIVPSIKAPVKVLSENEKLQARNSNPELCRVVSESVYSEYLRICREVEESENMVFEYFRDKHSMPVKIKHLKFGSSFIVVTLDETSDFGTTTARMDLSHDMLSDKGLFSSFAGGNEFLHNKCTLENVQAKNTNWRIKC